MDILLDRCWESLLIRIAPINLISKLQIDCALLQYFAKILPLDTHEVPYKVK